MSSTQVSSVAKSDYSSKIVKSFTVSEKPLLDNREYCVITLENGIEALLIHDPDTDKSAASLDVRVGSYADPVGIEGLAHFCEHLLFMGTEAFPKENEYSQYLSAHSGHSNAYTASEHTNYYFDVNNDSLKGALEIFSKFFICPLFSPACKDREIRAVDSENKNNLQNDDWRLSQIERTYSNPKHPKTKFSTGNIQTLDTIPTSKNIDVRERLLEFYDTHYSANLMRLCIIGTESIDTLKSWAAEYFSPIVNKNFTPPVYDSLALSPAEAQQIIFVKPVKNMKMLKLIFSVPDQTDFYDSKPFSYASSTIGHEGPGSILYHLKEKGWAVGLSAGILHVSKGQDQMQIKVDLTETGLKEYRNVIAIIFEYIHILRTSPINERIFYEEKVMSEISFKYRNKKDAMKTVGQYSADLQKDNLPREHLLSSSVFRKFDEEKTRDFLTYLRPDNCQITLVGKDLEGLDRKEKWYGTEHKVEPFDKELIESITNPKPNSALFLPEKNEFIPDNFDVEKKEVETPLKHPYLIRNQPNIRIWYKKDDTFWTPKAEVTIYFQSPIVSNSPSTTVKTALFLNLFEDSLNSMGYYAEVAGLRYSVSSTRDGFAVSVGGFNNKLGKLLERILSKLKGFEPTEAKFNVWKERFAQSYSNVGMGALYAQSSYHLNYLISENLFPLEEREQALADTTYEDVKTFGPLIYQQMGIEVVAFGNLYKQEVLDIGDLVINILKPRPLLESQNVKLRSYLLPPSTEFYYDIPNKDAKNINSCIEMVYQVGKLIDSRLRVVLQLFATIAHEPAFNQLRTREQLGYVVFSGMRVTRTTMGFRVLVQSERNCIFLRQRIERFLLSLGEILEGYSDEKFNEFVSSLITRKLEKVQNFKEESNEYNTHVMSGYYHFNLRYEEAEMLKTVTKKEVLDMFYTYISPQSDKRSILIVNHMAHNPPAYTLEQVVGSVFSSLASKYEVDFEPSEAAELAAKASGLSPEEILQLAKGVLEEKGHGHIAEKFITEAAEEIALQSGPEPEERVGVPITSVSEFKSKLTLTEAPFPYKDLSEYVETEAKL